MKQIEPHDHWIFEKREALNDALTDMKENGEECCEHPQYRELLRGAQCIHCGHFVGAWE